MIAFHVTGWYKTLPMECDLKPRCVSDGAIFSTLENARSYARQTMRSYDINQITVQDNDPQVDYYINEGLWTPAH